MSRYYGRHVDWRLLPEAPARGPAPEGRQAVAEAIRRAAQEGRLDEAALADAGAVVRALELVAMPLLPALRLMMGLDPDGRDDREMVRRVCHVACCAGGEAKRLLTWV